MIKGHSSVVQLCLSTPKMKLLILSAAPCASPGWTLLSPKKETVCRATHAGKDILFHVFTRDSPINATDMGISNTMIGIDNSGTAHIYMDPACNRNVKTKGPHASSSGLDVGHFYNILDPYRSRTTTRWRR